MLSCAAAVLGAAAVFGTLGCSALGTSASAARFLAFFPGWLPAMAALALPAALTTAGGGEAALLVEAAAAAVPGLGAGFFRRFFFFFFALPTLLGGGRGAAAVGTSFFFLRFGSGAAAESMTVCVDSAARGSPGCAARRPGGV